MFICHSHLANVIRLTSNFQEKIYGSLVIIYMVGFQENKLYFATRHNFSAHVLEMCENGM